MAKAALIKIHLKVAGFVDRKMCTAELDLEVPDKTSLKKFFRLADKSGKLPPRVIRKIMGLPRPPTILWNGTNVDLSELSRLVKAGDEVALMTPLGGG